MEKLRRWSWAVWQNKCNFWTLLLLEVKKKGDDEKNERDIPPANSVPCFLSLIKGMLGLTLRLRSGLSKGNYRKEVIGASISNML